MKKWMTVLFSLLLVAVVLPFVLHTATAETYSGTCGDSLTWSFDSTTGTLTIEGSGAMDSYEYAHFAPWYDYREQISSVLFPNGLTSIGIFAFYDCSGVTAITIPNSVTCIDYYAFGNCTGLTSVTIGNGITDIHSSAFNNTGWWNAQNNGLVYLDYILLGYKGTCPQSITVQDGTRIIADGAFARCSELKSVTIGNSVTSIGAGTFSNCTNLSSITIPDSVTSIGAWVFEYCTGLTSVTIGNGVTSIDSSAFRNCTGLTSLTMPVSAICKDGSSFDDCRRRSPHGRWASSARGTPLAHGRPCCGP